MAIIVPRPHYFQLSVPAVENYKLWVSIVVVDYCSHPSSTDIEGLVASGGQLVLLALKDLSHSWPPALHIENPSITVLLFVFAFTAHDQNFSEIDRCHDCHSSRHEFDFTIYARDLHQLPASSRWTIPAVCIRRNGQSLNGVIPFLRKKVFSQASIDILAKAAATVATPYLIHARPVDPNIVFDRVNVDKS